MNHILTFCLLTFILAGNLIINTDHIAKVYVYANRYEVCFDHGAYNPECVIVLRKDAPNLVQILLNLNNA